MNNNISKKLVKEIEKYQNSNDLAKSISMIHATDDAKKRYFVQLCKQGISEDEAGLMLKEFYKTDHSPKSRFQSKEAYILWTGLWNTVERITKSYKEPKQQLLYPIEIASGFTGNINAHVVTLDKSEFAIIIDETIMVLAQLICKIFAQTIPYSQSEQDEGKISFSIKGVENVIEKINDPENKATERFFDLFMSTIIYGRPSLAQQYYLDITEEEAITNSIRNNFELFVIAHEYAHIFFNHLDDAKHISPEENEGIILNPSLQFSHQCELEADIFAVEIVVRNSMEQEENPFFAIVGSLLFFECQLLIERCIYLLKHGKDICNEPDYMIGCSYSRRNYSTHPHAFTRKFVLLEMLKKSDLNEDDFIDNIDKFINKVSETLWAKSLDGFMHLHNQKVEIHPIWESLANQINVDKKIGLELMSSEMVKSIVDKL